MTAYENVWKRMKTMKILTLAFRLLQDVSWISWPGPMPRSTWEHCASGVRAFSPSTSALKLSRCLAQIWKAYHKLYDYMSVWQHNFSIFGSGGLILFGCFMSRNVFRTSGSRLVHPSDFLCCPFCVSDSRKKSSGVIGQRSHATAASTKIGVSTSQPCQLRSVQSGLRAYRFFERRFMWVVSRSSLEHLAIPREDTSVHIFCSSWKKHHFGIWRIPEIKDERNRDKWDKYVTSSDKPRFKKNN